MHKTDAPLAAAQRALRDIEVAAKQAMPSTPAERAKWRAQIEQAKREIYKAHLQSRYGHKQGTPETYAHIDAVPPRQRQGALARMATLGKINADELAAACEIASVAEMIETNVGFRGASLEARVDGSGSGRDVLVEALGRVRLEVSYSVWRGAIPTPKAMILDMIVRDLPYVAVARSYRLNYRTARKRMITALRLWMEIRDQVRDQVDVKEVQEVYWRLGEGILLPPKIKLEASDEA